jgi:sulfofructose kinase
MSGDERLDVFGLGQCALDHIGRVDPFPDLDTKAELLENLVIAGGGPVATALVALTRWGWSCTLASVVGDDDAGARILASLEEERIDLRGVVTRPGGASQFAFVAVEARGGQRTIFWRRPTGQPLRPDEVDGERLRSSRIFLTDGLQIESSLAAARVARDARVPVVVDGGTLRDGMLDLVRLADVAIVSERFATQLVGGDDPRGACRRVAELGPTLAGVTLGARGWVALDEQRALEGAAYRVEAVDTTGCGDVFHAGFVHGELCGWPRARSLDFAAWAASRVALAVGGRAGIPDAGAWPGTGAAAAD